MSDRDSGEIDAVGRLLARWAGAVAVGNLDRIADLVAPDGEFWSPGAAPLVGRKAVRAAFAGILERYRFEQYFECAEIVVRDDLAFVRGIEHNRLHPRDGGAPIEKQQRAFSILRREADGEWRFWRGMTHLPPAAE